MPLQNGGVAFARYPELLHSDDRQRVVSAVAEALRGGARSTWSTNDDDTEEEIHAFRVADGMAVVMASDGKAVELGDAHDQHRREIVGPATPPTGASYSFSSADVLPGWPLRFWCVVADTGAVDHHRGDRLPGAPADGPHRCPGGFVSGSHLRAGRSGSGASAFGKHSSAVRRQQWALAYSAACRSAKVAISIIGSRGDGLKPTCS